MIASIEEVCVNRKIVLSVLIVALLGISGLCAVTGYGLYRWGERNRIGVNLLRVENFSAQTTEKKTFAVSQPASLEISNEFGDISVTAADVSEIQVDLIKEAWGTSQAEADANAAALQVDVRQTGNRLILSFHQPDQFVVAGRVHVRRVDFNVRVPAETAVKLVTVNGALALDGLQADAELHSSFGEIDVRNHSGRLLADGANSNLIIENVKAGAADIQLLSSFGSIQAKDLEGGSIQVESSNGEISMEDITANGMIDLKNSFAMIKIDGFHADSMNIDSQNGPLEVISGEVTGILKATDSFGNVTVSDVSAATYTLETNNGRLELDGAQGELKLTNEFGDISVQNADQVTLQAQTSNGKIEFTGSLAVGDEHTIENSFGDVTLHLPADSSFNFNLETEFGRISSELPLTLSGEMSENQWQGEVNGGGPTLRVTTNNGNIKILAQPAR
jgi:DUF4097 and DUF4098 domain-containing protein YvlB